MAYFDFYASLLLAIILARLFFRIGAEEYRNGWVVCLMSVALSMIGISLLPGGVRTVAILHGLLYIALWAYNCVMERYKTS